MKPKEFLDQLDDARVVAAIEAAERRTSGEIRVFVSARTLGGDDVVERAGVRFRKLGMTQTRQRNGILFYFVPRDRKFAVIGDAGIHAKCGPEFWDGLAERLQERLARGEFTAAVVEAIGRAGAALEVHFPDSGGGANELPNAVDRD